MNREGLGDIISVFQGGVRLTVRAKPGLSRQRDIKIVDIGNGKRAIEVSVAAEARDGKANQALIERLSETWGIPRKDISLKAGDTGRLKIVEIRGEGEALEGHILLQLMK